MMSLREQVNRSKLVGYSLLSDNLNLQGIWKKLLFELTVGSLPASRLFLGRSEDQTLEIGGNRA